MEGKERNLKTSEKKVKGKEWEQGGSQWGGEKRWANRGDRKWSVFNLCKPHGHSKEVDRIHILK